VNAFPTVGANWDHFELIDIDPAAQQVQRKEMKRAFLAGAASGLALAVAAYNSKDPQFEIAVLIAELREFTGR
jgi:hypothetical protein